MIAGIAFSDSSESRRLFPAARGRLVVAVTLSALLHFWFVARMPLERAGVTPRPPPATIAVRLEPPATMLQEQALSHPGTATTEEKSVRRNRLESGAVPDDAVHSSAPHKPPAQLPAREAAQRPASLAAVSTPDTTYYLAHQLDVYPALLHSAGLGGPEHAPQDRVAGRVLVMLRIDETGHVNDVSIVKAEPAGDLEDAARIAFATARFSPARKDGRAVKSRVLVDIRYDPADAEPAGR
jgi:protein TonB